MSITARKLKSGKTVFDATMEYGRDDHGNRIRETKTFETRKEAEAAEKKAKQTASALKSKSDKLKLCEYIERCYWPITSRRLQATSLDTYEREIKLRILPYLGDLQMGKIDRYAIQKIILIIF